MTPATFSNGWLNFELSVLRRLKFASVAFPFTGEPELGLHPAAIVQLAALLRLASRESQVNESLIKPLYTLAADVPPSEL